MKTCCTGLWVELTDMLLLSSLIPLLLVVSQYHILEVSSPIVGVILLGTFMAATFLMWKRRTPSIKIDNVKATQKKNLKLIITKLLFSFIGVLVAARLAVFSAVNIATFLGIPQSS